MITWRSILRGAFTRFLPGAAGLILALVAMVVARGTVLDDGWTRLLALEVASLSAGYAVVLGFMRRQLRADAVPDSGKSMIVGAAATAVLLLVTDSIPHWRPWSLALASFSAGGLSAALMFFPWLTRRAAADPATHAMKGTER